MYHDKATYHHGRPFLVTELREDLKIVEVSPFASGKISRHTRRRFKAIPVGFRFSVFFSILHMERNTENLKPTGIALKRLRMP